MEQKMTNKETPIEIQNQINLKPIDLTTRTTMVKAYRNLEDPQDIMSLCNGPKFTSTSPHDRLALPNLTANGHEAWKLYNTNLNTVNDFPLSSGFGYNYSTGISARQPYTYLNQPLEVSYNRDMTVELQNIEDIQNSFNQRGVNFVNNAGPNTGYVASNYLQNFQFNVNTHRPNILLFNRLFSVYVPAKTTNSITYHLQIVKMTDINANIRTATPFPNHPQRVPVPTDDTYALLDCSSLIGTSSTDMEVLAYHLCNLETHYTNNSDFWFYILDPSNTMSGTFSFSATTTPQISWRYGIAAPLIARLLDDTLTRQDVRWALWFNSLPLPRFLSNSDFALNDTNANKPKLTISLWRPDNKQAYMKWLAKKGVEHNEYTISSLIGDEYKAMSLFRDVRICRTFFYQVVTYMFKMSVAPDSNVLMDDTRIRNLIEGNINGIGTLYTTVKSETTTYYSSWFAWIPYELAHAVNSTVNLDKPRWRISKTGRKIADSVKRSRSIMFEPGTTGQLEQNYYNQNDTDTASNPLKLTINLPSNRHLTINAMPISIYWETAKFPIYSTTFDESIIVSDEYLEEHAYFPEIDLEQSWN
jgi:hypothetical protein